MCKDCGCGIVEGYEVDGIPVVPDHHSDHEGPHTHPHRHEHPHNHPHAHDSGDPSPHHSVTLSIHEGILEKNDRLAERNRGFFAARGWFALNVLSSPGSGKTAFIERMLSDLREELPMGVVVGDLATDNDANRLRATGAPVVQITTGTVCHLEAEMVANAVRKLPADGLKGLVIENVGNLVCPASYDLGEDLRVVLLSVTEGEDKPLKYPVMFKSADVVILSKTDIAEAVGFERETALANLRQVAPQATLFEVSAKTGAGMADWYGYLRGYADNASVRLS